MDSKHKRNIPTYPKWTNNVSVIGTGVTGLLDLEPGSSSRSLALLGNKDLKCLMRVGGLDTGLLLKPGLGVRLIKEDWGKNCYQQKLGPHAPWHTHDLGGRRA